MAILLHLLNLFLCLRAVHRSSNSRGRMALIVIVFLVGTVLSFGIALALKHDYLDGLTHLVAGGASVLLFWFVVLVQLFTRARRDKVRVDPVNVAIVCLALLVPAGIGLLIANMQFKIGG